MGLIRLAVCVSGVYAAFLLWAIAQERLSAPFPSLHPHADNKGDKFPNPLFLNYAQAVASSIASATYLLVKSCTSSGSVSKQGLGRVLGLDQLFGAKDTTTKKTELIGKGDRSDGSNGMKNGSEVKEKKQDKVESVETTSSQSKKTPWYRTLPALLLQVSLFQTTAGPIGFLSLRHISYPTMVLGKSCKLIPVLILNVLLYRRKFSSHKYIVVSLVTIGISMFMLFADNTGKKKKGGGGDSLWGLTLLLVNLIIDGLTNSTQDQIFTLYPSYSGQQMMFIMSCMTQLVLLPAMLLPLPTHPLSLLSHLPFPVHLPLLFSPLTTHQPLTLSSSAFLESIRFIISHPTCLAPLLAYALLGGLGQLFIFETIQHFGSLTLVMVTVTRKLFTMLLSVFLFEHSLTNGQWAGVAVVFGGIGVEAAIKRRDVMRRARRDKK